MPAPLQIAVAYHDVRPHPSAGDAPFTAVCNVGIDGTRPPGFTAYDDEGGYPDRNVMYGELSALRWLQNNSDAAVLGLAHYRRLWTRRRHLRSYSPRTYEARRWDWADLSRQGAATQDLLSAMHGAPWCSAPVYDVRWAGHLNLVEQFAVHHPLAVVEAAAEAVRDVTPDWPGFGDYLSRSVTLRPFNMLLAQRPLLEEYLQWLWPVLDATVSRVGIPADPYQTRYPGFIAERLHGYWLDCAPPARNVTAGTVGVAIVPAEGLTNSAAPGGLDGVSVNRPPVGATDLMSSAARYLPFGMRSSAMRVVRQVRPW